MKDKVETKKKGEVDSSKHAGVDVVRGDTQMYGVTAPDPSRPDLSREKAEVRASSMVSFGDKKIDLEKMRDSYIGELVAGRFTITQFIDRGGMGEVYLGENEAVGQRVAVKFLSRKFTSDESIVTRFGNEAKSYARVNHPNAVTLLDYGQHDDGALYIITEFVDGKSLSKTIKKTGPFNPHQVISIGQQCCDVLTTAHSLGVIHRDLKPDNVMLIPNTRDRYTVKILDFGIAKLSDDEHGSMTETGAIFGTPEFMSPEQARGDGAEPRSDLYALGVILYYMMTGKLPFGGKNKFAILNKHLNDPPPRPSDLVPHLEIVPALEGVILKCLNKRPEERYESADALYEALEEVRDLLGSTGSSTTSAPPVARQRPDLVLPDALDEDSALVEAELEVLQTNDLDPIDESLDMSRDESVPPVQLGAYASLPGVELDEEIEELHEDEPELDEDELWEDWEEGEGGGRLKLLLVAMLCVGVIGGLGWYVMQMGEKKGDVVTRVGDTSLDAITSAGDGKQAQQSSGEIQNILVTSQVLGLLASAEQSVLQGELGDARRQIETTKMWLSDEALPEEGARRRREIESSLKDLFVVEKELKTLRAGNRCEALEAKLAGLASRSPGLHERWSKIASECVSRANKPRTEDPKQAPKKEPTPPPVKKDPPTTSSPGLPSPDEVVNGTSPDKKPPVEDDTPPKDVEKAPEQGDPPGQEDTGLPPKVL